jgi:pyrroline-5-carboxylate reductase
MKKFGFGFLGGGNMAEAILSGILGKKLIDPEHIVIAEISVPRKTYLEQTYGVRVTANAEEMLREVSMVLIAVKPYQFEQIVSDTYDAWQYQGAISIMAGWSYEKLGKVLPQTTRLLRVMPNTAAKIAQAMSALFSGYTLAKDEYQMARNIFTSCGEIVEIPEHYIHVITAISGSGPAYAYMFIDALTQGGVLHGLPKDTARKLAVQTVLGAAEMVKATGLSPNELKDAVCTPGGTTIEAVYALEHHAFTATVMDAVKACVEKSKNMQ